jgi:hypothetical protein
MVNVPTGSFVVVMIAVPLFRVALPSVVVPFVNVTVPVGPPGAAERTVAVSVTACPEIEGFGSELTVVVDG